MSRARARARVRGAARSADVPSRLARLFVLVLLVAAPLAFGAVHAAAYGPLLAVAFLAGAAAQVLAWRRRRAGRLEPPLPAGRLLLVLHGLVLLQLVPLPPALLRIVSPGSAAFHERLAIVSGGEWRPVSVSPPDTLRGLLFLAGMSLLYAAVFRLFRDGSQRRRLATAVALTGLAVTVVALVQASSGEPRIYGLWRPRHDWAVFGPYVNRNHFAGLIVMAIPLALGLALEALTGLRRAWSRRRWLSIGDAAGNAAVRHFAVSAALVTGLLASRSRGGFVAFVVAAIALPLASRRRAPAVAVAGAAGGVAVLWVGLDAILRGFEMRGLGPSRLVLWSDALRMLPDFPAFGAGFNAFGTAYRPYQTFWPYLFVGEAHNEYLQLLLDTGLAGAAVGAAILAKLFVAAVRGAGRSALGAGIFAALLAECVHNLVEFNWQIPANAATFAAVAGLAVSGSRPQSLADPVPAPAEVGRHRTPEAQGR